MSKQAQIDRLQAEVQALRERVAVLESKAVQGITSSAAYLPRYEISPDGYMRRTDCTGRATWISAEHPAFSRDGSTGAEAAE